MTGADVASSVGSADGSSLAVADAAGVGAGATSSLSLSGRVITTTASKIMATMIAISTLPEAPCLGASFGLLVCAAGVAAPREAGFGAVLTSTRPAPTDDGTGGITIDEADAARFLTADFLTARFLTADFLTAFFAVFFTALFLATDFLATDFFAALFFFAAVFLTAGFFFAAVFLTAGFFLTATITPCFG